MKCNGYKREGCYIKKCKKPLKKAVSLNVFKHDGEHYCKDCIGKLQIEFQPKKTIFELSYNRYGYKKIRNIDIKEEEYNERIKEDI